MDFLLGKLFPVSEVCINPDGRFIICASSEALDLFNTYVDGRKSVAKQKLSTQKKELI